MIRLLRHLLPSLENMLSSRRELEQAPDEDSLVAWLKTSTAVGILPVPHPIMIRKYRPNQFTSVWFTTYMWGAIYLRSQRPLLWDASAIQLFVVQTPAA